MDLSTFLQERRPSWRRLEELLKRAEGSGLVCLSEDEVVEFGNLYRRAASDLNQAQTFVSGDSDLRFLNDLVARAYLLIYGKTKIDLRGAAMFLIWGWPAVFRRYLPHFLLAGALFALGHGLWLSGVLSVDQRSSCGRVGPQRPVVSAAERHEHHSTARGGTERSHGRHDFGAI